MIILNSMVMGKESKDRIVCALVDNAIQLGNLMYCMIASEVLVGFAEEKGFINANCAIEMPP